MRLRVDENDGVRCHFWVVGLQEIFDRSVEVLRGRFFDDDHLGRRRRLRLGNLERLERRLQRRRWEFKVERRARVWWR